MDEKLMKRVGYLILGSYAVFNVITLFLVDRFPIGEDVAGPYSIYSSRGFFFAYHIWGIALAIVTIYAMYREIRTLFMITLVLLMIVMFYPWFTAGPMDQAQQQDRPRTEQPDTGTVD